MLTHVLCISLASLQRSWPAGVWVIWVADIRFPANGANVDPCEGGKIHILACNVRKWAGKPTGDFLDTLKSWGTEHWSAGIWASQAGASVVLAETENTM